MIKEVIMPKLGETMEEGYLAEWKKEEGERVEKNEVLFEVMSDKTNFEVESLYEGYLRKKLFQPSDEPIKVTTVVAYISDTPDEPLPDKPSGSQEAGTEKEVAEKGAAKLQTSSGQKDVEPGTGDTESRVKASPLARKVADDSGLDISLVAGSGPGGRIEKKDVLDYIEKKSIPGGEDKDEKSPGSYEVEPWTPLRRIIAKRLSESKREIPHYYFQGKMFIDEIKRVKESRKKENIGLTYTDFLIFLAAKALHKYPLINAGLVDNEIRLYKSVDIGLAISVEEALMVPVLRDCANKDIVSLSEERKLIVDRARGNKLNESDMKGARFVISNLGMYGVENFQPIINPPGLAIMGVGRINEEPAVSAGRIEIRTVMNVSFSFDHRIVDGSYAGLFYSYFKGIVENPSMLVF